jgi:hypothetical protein
MQATQFMRVPFFVQGYCVTKDNMNAIARWCGGAVVEDSTAPYVRVPVIRPTHPKQTRGYIETWVVRSNHRGEATFKVYTEEWLRKQFLEIGSQGRDFVTEEAGLVSMLVGEHDLAFVVNNYAQEAQDSLEEPAAPSPLPGSSDGHETPTPGSNVHPLPTQGRPRPSNIMRSAAVSPFASPS